MSQRGAGHGEGPGDGRPAASAGRAEAPPGGALRTERRRIVLLLVAVAAATAVAHVAGNALLGGEGAYRPSFLQYALLSGNVLLVFALAFYLFRYLIRLLSERRAGLLGSRFKFKLVATFIGLCILPAVVLYWMAILAISSAVNRALAPDASGAMLDAQALSREYHDDKLHGFASDVRGAAAALAPSLSAGEGRGALGERLRGEAAARGFAEARIYFQGGAEPLRAGVQAAPGSPLAPESAEEIAADERALGAARSGRPFELLRSSRGEQHVVAGAPIGALGPGAEPFAVLVATRPVPRDPALRAQRLRDWAEDRATLQRQGPWIKTQQALLFLGLSLVIVLAATWVSLHVARSITVPIQRLAVGTEALRRGELAHVVEWEGKDELGLLVEGFNDMSRELRTKAEALEHRALELREANVALESASLEARRGRDQMAMLLQALSAGVIAIDADGIVAMANPAAAHLLELPAGTPAGRSIEEFLSPEPLAALRREIRSFLGSEATRAARDLELTLARGPVHLQAVLTSRPGGAGGRPGALAVFEDVTELVRAQKVATWETVARRIAHEIKNPLTPIQLSAQRILKKHRERSAGFDAVLEAGIETITAEVTGLQQMVDEFSRFARMPPVRPAPGDVNALLRSVAALYAGHEGLGIALDLADPPPAASFDAEALRRAVVNLVDNALEAMEGRGRVTLRTAVRRDPATLRVEVEDDGPGVPPEDRERLFLPYFTTKARGTGLGLAIVHRVAADHHGRVRVEDAAPRGARFVLELPMPARPSRLPAGAEAT